MLSVVHKYGFVFITFLVEIIVCCQCLIKDMPFIQR